MQPRGGAQAVFDRQLAPITGDKRALVVPRSALRRVQLKLDVANPGQEFRHPGDFIFIDRLSTGIVSVQLNNTSEDPLPLGAQDGFEGLPYESFFVSWTAQPGLVANVWYGYEATFKIGAQSISTIGSILNPVSLTKSTTLNSVADVALGNAVLTAVLAADPTRVQAIISSLAANTQKIRLGDSVNTGAARGVELSPGQSITIADTAAISAFAPAAGQTVAILTINN